MAKCIKLQRKKTQVCAGSLNRKIQIFERNLTPPVDPLTGQFVYTETFTLIASPWAMIETPSGETIFDTIGIERVVDNVFYIRFLANLTSENWITYDNNRYDIIRVTNLEKNKLFLQLNCALTGDDTKEASKA